MNKISNLKIEEELEKQIPFMYNTNVMLEDIHFGETAYHISYMKMMDRARAHWLLSIGSSNSQMYKDRKFLAISSVNVKFMKPAMLEDSVEVLTRVHSLTGTGFIFSHQVKNKDGDIYCKAEYKMVSSLEREDGSLKPSRLKDSLPKIYSKVKETIED